MPTNDLILVINCGSSSLKYALYECNSFTVLAQGLAESLDAQSSRINHTLGTVKSVFEQPGLDHKQALNWVTTTLDNSVDLSKRLRGIGHRVVHGGEQFKSSVKIDAAVMSQIHACIPLAPLHNPPNLLGIEILQEAYPEAPQVAVFDTAFHQSLPPHAYLYALPYDLYREHGVRRYGFHGTSHRFIAREAVHLLQLQHEPNLINAHLGNGASVCAIREGRSVDTSMGMTPLEGLVMGTRSGDIDPGLFDFLLALGYSTQDISKLLNKRSGLLGLSAHSNDMRTLISAADNGNQQAAIAIEVFCFRLAKYIAAMMASLSSLDALVFTGGIGENAARVRSKTLQHLSILGFQLDEQANKDLGRGKAGIIHATASHPVWVIPTDEERMIAQDTAELTTK